MMPLNLPSAPACNVTSPVVGTQELRVFMAATPRRLVAGAKPSRMDPFRAEIVTLNKGGYSLARIQEFLRTQGITVSRTAIHNYLRSMAPAVTPTSPT